MAGISAAELAKINSFPKLVDLLRNHLEWPIEEDYGFEDVVYEYEASELGLKPNEIAKIREIHQLRPLATSQPWGIFFISFEDKALSVTVLRRILKNLILKKRAGAQASDRQAWEKNDLIFAANFGNSGSRELAFVHFSDGAQSRDLPVMKVLGWNAKDTQLHNDYVGRTLAEKLRWPDDPKDLKKWRGEWSSAFELRLNEIIRTSKDLALKLAGLATEIRARANELLMAETDRGPMRTMLEAFRKSLIHDLDDDGFADMFAQTIAYGMLAARISRPMGIVADNLADMLPKTNPFLKELFANFLAIGGRGKRQSLDFDELGVRDVVDMLNAANMEAVLRDFGDRNPKEDPVIHFYELFLKEYDPQKRMQRGVFYTPRPVVNFIIRSVDEALRTEFELPLGLADTSTWAEIAARNDRIIIPSHVRPDTPFVQILDPATGTGTFLVEVIDLIHKRMEEHWKDQGKSAIEIKAAWNAYVPTHLLPRLTAFELMMAPYTIAHMKVGLKLSETGYKFGSEERARIFLTNALEPARDLDMQFIFMSEALAHEAQGANEAKATTPFTAVIGNPPYGPSNEQLNPTKLKNGKPNWIGGLLEDYMYFDGKHLNEKNPKSAKADEIKFIRLAQFLICRSGYGIFSYINPHGYFDAVISRGVRQSLRTSFEKIFFLDLHGNANRGLAEGDQNVFDIKQGVAINTFLRSGCVDRSIRIANLIGPREGLSTSKYEILLHKQNSDVGYSEIQPYSFDSGTAENLSDRNEYNGFSKISEVFISNDNGFKSHRDQFAVAFSESEIELKLNDFRDKRISDEEISNKYELEDNRDWSVQSARSRASKLGNRSPDRISMFPFDFRFTLLDTSFMDFPRGETLRSAYLGPSIVTSRQTKDMWDAKAFQEPVNHKVLAKYDTNYLFPLWLKASTGEVHFRPNIDLKWAVNVGNILNLIYEDGIPRGEQTSSGLDFRRPKTEQIGLLDIKPDGRGDLQRTFGPHDLFDYIYAVLHSPGYRIRYAEFLKSDFPGIPIPKFLATFVELIALGRQLVALHLLRPEEAPILKSPEIRFAGVGEARVAKGYPEYTNGKAMINPSRWFEDVPKATWEYHVGGYQVCEKWLKDRAGKGGKNPGPGRVLSEEDILHYRRVVVALTETSRLMAEIDVQIDKHGGWPDAFVTGARGN
jgi:hypothetical protein